MPNKIHSTAILETNVRIGTGCRIGAYTFICDNTIIGSDVFIGQHVSFCNDRYPPSHGAWKKEPPIIIEDGVSIGSGVIILPSITIGKNSTIGAGAVVTKSVPANSVVKGNPAK
jgi:acetyltransferase-like isoleucine patch superfamily enzyme